MIIFYQKSDGKIVGTIDGRVHGQEHANMWIGDRDKIDRLVIQWISKGQKEIEIEREIEIGKEIDENGFFKPITEKVKEKIKTAEFEPNINGKDQKEIIIAIDKNPISIYDYRIDTNSLKLVKK